MLCSYWGHHEVESIQGLPLSLTAQGVDLAVLLMVQERFLIVSSLQPATEDPPKLGPSLRSSLMGDHSLEIVHSYHLYI